MNFRINPGIVLIITCLCLTCVDFAQAQRNNWQQRLLGGDDKGLSLLTDKNVQAELELVDEQIEELEELQKEGMQVITDAVSEMRERPRGGDRGDFMRDIGEKIKEKMEPVMSRVDEVLLPHQRDRLNQLSFQSKGRNQGAGGALMSERMLEELEVTPSQREELEEAIEEAKKELKEEYAKLVKEAEKDILKVLDSGQRKKYKELVGDAFEFSDPSRDRNRRNRENNDRGDRRRGN